MKAFRTIIKRALLVGVMCATALPATASAEGLLIGQSDLAEADWLALNQAIDSARKTNPAAFQALDQVRADLRALDAQKRGPYAPVASHLRALGPDGLMPMLEAIAVDGVDVGDLPESAQVAWETGLLEAVGGLGDLRAAPVLRAVLSSPRITEFNRVRSAAQAVGGTCADDASVALLVSSAAVGQSKRAAVLTGMGLCRRAAAARTLVDALDTKLDARTRHSVYRSLSDIGNSWVWQATGAVEGDQVRAIVARGLVTSYVREEDRFLRRQAEKALMVVDYVGTPALIDAALTAAVGDQRADLERLAKRFAANPVRTR